MHVQTEIDKANIILTDELRQELASQKGEASKVGGLESRATSL